MPRNQKNSNYLNQSYEARKRGIDWQFTYTTWCEFWGDDYQCRGKGKNKLQMCRYNDTGPYSPDNCYKATHSDNIKDFYISGIKREQWYENMMKTAITRRKPVMTPAGEFESLRAAALHYNLTPEGIGYRCKTATFPDWYYP
jgi:hypothetical protein